MNLDCGNKHTHFPSTIIKYTFSFNVCVHILEYIQFGLWKEMETLNPSQDI
jgi:hypothetical protein